jgi:hypothetical protein
MNDGLQSKLDRILDALIENSVQNEVFSYINYAGGKYEPGSREGFKTQLVGAVCVSFEAQLLGIARAYETMDQDVEYDRPEIRAMVERRSGRIETAVEDILSRVESRLDSTDPLSDIESGIESGSSGSETEIFGP